ncbi:MAG TPA: hypothetical protein VJ044_14405, partial [Candidatus Hodarchaeales archaeon]|nr:hypothetical protein [Candidatus Hodarchaeales archaeon]
MTAQTSLLELATEEPAHDLASEPSVRQRMKGLSGYRRYAIAIKEAPPRYKLPHPFNPIVKRLGLAKMLVHEALEYNFRLIRKKYRKRLMARPCIYGVFSGPFGGFSPRKAKCTGCLRCVQEFPEFCTVQRNPSFLDFADEYWSPPDTSKLQLMGTPYSIIWFEAATGKIQVRGMGYKGPFSGPGWDSMWTDMSEIVRPTRDGVYGREFISTVVDIGRKPARASLDRVFETGKPRIVQISIPMIFDYLSSQYSNP